MACERLKTWIESSSTASSARLPTELLQHSRECPFCATQVKNLKQVEQAIRAFEPSLVEIAEIKSAVLSDVERIRDSKMARFNFWKLIQPSPALLAFVIIAFMAITGGSFYFLRGSTPQQEMIVEETFQLSGTSGIIFLPDGRQLAVSASGQNAPLESRVSLPSGTSFTIQIAACGTVQVTGNGDLVLKKDGFFTKNGSFVASFVRTQKPFKVFVPQATLGIRGTKIAFNLNAGAGSLELLEGLVEVQPASAGAAPFAWKPGEKILLEKERLTMINPGAPLPPKPPVVEMKLPSPISQPASPALKTPEVTEPAPEPPESEPPTQSPLVVHEEVPAPSDVQPSPGTLGQSGD